jgi:two-component system, OmpR family, phosphate regulon sensor histidine kinase PhoR
MKFWTKLTRIAWVAFVILFVTGMLTAAFFITGYLYHLLGFHPGQWLALIINTFLGLFLTGITISLATRIAAKKGWLPERNAFAPILAALERIAKGDFSIQLTNEFKDNRFVGELADGVNRMAFELSQMEQMRQEFISNVSHEIQSPLTSIRGFAQALHRTDLSPEERDHYLEVIETESMRLSRITENLLRMATLESPQVKFEPNLYRLDKQIRGIILACEPQWNEKSISMEISLEEIPIVADEDLLSQVWNNLIHNSIKFSPASGKISITLCRSGGQVIFKITDSGVGISQADQIRIFERFFKADPSRTKSNGGSGLGLSITKKIVEMHHGTIAVDSQVGEGATFTVTLPA